METIKPRATLVLCSGVFLLLISLFLIQVAADDDATLDCDSQVNGLAGNCMTAVLFGTKPSSKCCKFVRSAQLDCLCSKITKDVTKMITEHLLSTALKIAKQCNWELPHNYQCGSYTFP
ncbi:uncharacterized protein LOC112342835 [Selaginella moellendorffii]|uniref:uncharacterized protein LOC112342835 n=1 Tax=Selaginella moellendorffii TaxID=88036 RepID=UPI000D1CC7C0|nr:uncharacterized protein LOC112342835 [Selaginella moellendorffii]|eukprot:XP_024521092.1 uncharacterized protein LOC112342835 [Selaginella moellendorffii]